MIPKEKIAEWKALADAGYPLAYQGCPPEWRLAPEYHGGESAASEAITALLFDREEMLALLREVEWDGNRNADPEEWGGDGACCPSCGGLRPDPSPSATRTFLERNGAKVGHSPDCRLSAFLKET